MKTKSDLATQMEATYVDLLCSFQLPEKVKINKKLFDNLQEGEGFTADSFLASGGPVPFELTDDVFGPFLFIFSQ